MTVSANVELTRRILDAWNSRDIEAWIAYFDPSIEWYSTFAAVGGAVYHGHEGLAQEQRDMEDEWGDEVRIEPEVFFDLGEHVLYSGVLRGRGRQSGVEVVMPLTVVFGWRDGLCVYLKGYGERDDALRDLGVSEDSLEPLAP